MPQRKSDESKSARQPTFLGIRPYNHARFSWSCCRNELSNESSIEEFKWQAHPARERPRAALLAGAIIVALGAVVWVSFGAVWAVGSVLLLVASLSRFFLASRFSIDGDGISARYPLRRARLRWAEIRRFVQDHHGGYLSTRARPSRLDAYRGMHLLFGTQRQRAIQHLQAHLTVDSVQTSDVLSSTPALERSALSLDGGR